MESAVSEEQYSMVQECADSYMVEDQPDGGAVITIKVPKRFKLLWMVRLTDLRTTMSEIDEHAAEG